MQPDLETIEAARATTRWGTPHEHASLGAFLAATEIADGMHTIRGEIVPIDFLVRINPGRPLIFSFHDSTPRNPNLKLPVFTGLNIIDDLDASYVALSDPSLYLHPELKLAWFSGSDGLELQKLFPALLDKLIALSGARDVICAGGSGGGFAALYYSAHIDGSFAVTWNPHTDIIGYNPAHVAEYGSAAFGLESYEATATQLGSLIDTNLAAVYAERRNNMVLYLQNNSDGYVVTQMRPFLAALGVDVGPLHKGSRINGVVADGLWLLLEHWGDGHVAPPAPALGALLAAIVADPARWRAGWKKRENTVARSRQSAA
jgi:hypothetical protein